MFIFRAIHVVKCFKSKEENVRSVTAFNEDPLVRGDKVRDVRSEPIDK